MSGLLLLRCTALTCYNLTGNPLPSGKPMKRREFITLIGGAAAWPFAVHAQQAGNAARIGIVPVGSASNTYDVSLVEAFRAGIRQVGLDETSVDLVWVKNEDEYAQDIGDLLQRGVRVLVTMGTSASLEAKRQTSTTPIVFAAVGDPIGVKLFESLSHPGGNVTGFADILLDLASKYVGFARELQTTVYCLWYKNWTLGQKMFGAAEQAAQSLHLELRSRGISDIAEANDSMAAMKASGAGTLIIQASHLCTVTESSSSIPR
jgi:putative tryptophan/tyrosine transport system substrate-binding protein